jgi:DNA-binding NtrC family response regulator
VRQLENICHWLTVMAPAQVIEPKDLPPEVLAPFAGDAVDPAGLDQRFERLAHQNVVDAQAAVLLVAQHSVVPPAVAFLGLVKHAKAVGQAQADQAVEMIALLYRVVNRVLEPHRVK